MASPMYIYRILHRPGSRARALVNGVPVYDRIVKDNVAPAQPITHWLATGDNTLTFELSLAPKSPLTPYLDAHFEFWIQDDKDQGNKLFQWVYPSSLQASKLPTELPLVHNETYKVGMDLPTPAYANASREDFPAEGTPELKAAVYELYDSFASKDAGRFEKVMEVKSGEFDRYYSLPPNSKAEALQNLNAPWVMEPFDDQDLRFERYLDGRLARVYRASGKPAVRAVHRNEPYLGWGSDFFLTRLDGSWRIYW